MISRLKPIKERPFDFKLLRYDRSSDRIKTNNLSYTNELKMLQVARGPEGIYAIRIQMEQMIDSLSVP